MSENRPRQITIEGAGIMGLTCAYTLSCALPEIEITIIDPAGFPADNASRMAGGMLAPWCECDHLPPEYIPAGLQSIAFWQEFSEETAGAIEFAQQGSLILAHAEDRHMIERLRAVLPPGNAGTPVDLAQTEPLLAERFKHGLLIEGEAHLHPRKTMEALLKSLRTKNVALAEKHGANNMPDLRIDTRGLGAQDDQPDLRGVKGEILIVRNPDFSLKRPVRLMHPRYPLYIVPREGNIFMIGATIIESADDHVTLRSGLELMSALYSLHPTFAHAEVLEIKAGVRPAYPDNLPRITHAGDLIHANGLFRHGFLLAPAMAACICDMITGTANDLIPLLTKDKNDENHHKRRRKTA